MADRRLAICRVNLGLLDGRRVNVTANVDCVGPLECGLVQNGAHSAQRIAHRLARLDVCDTSQTIRKATIESSLPSVVDAVPLVHVRAEHNADGDETVVYFDEDFSVVILPRANRAKRK
jgi:hypothetical protein